MSLVLKLLLIVEIVLSIVIFIFEHSSFSRLSLWLMLNLLLPILGFILYFTLENKLKLREKNRINESFIRTKNYLKQTSWYKDNSVDVDLCKGNKILNYITTKLKFEPWLVDSCNIMKNGNDFIKSLINDIKDAKKSINLQFYIFSDDKTSKNLIDHLISKSNDGVKINILYDAFGSHKTSKQYWEKLRSNGIRVIPYFPPFFKIFYTKINYRNHRKLVIIDGKIAYTGGLNIRDDHMGKISKLSPWRDTEVRLTGSIVYPLQNIFLNDFCHAGNIDLSKDEIQYLFPQICTVGKGMASVVTSGPNSDKENIKRAFGYAIKNSKIIFLQTPYFVVDEALRSEIINAKKNGAEVKIIVPLKPDKKIVYALTLDNIKDLFYSGIEIYLYKGFIHSKVAIFDDAVSLGTCNFDNRSLKYNFEHTVFFYDKNFIKTNIKIFNGDLKNSIKLDEKKIKRLCRKYKVFGIFKKILNRYL